ncbi:MAG: hypothetical protein ING27_07930 [Burkholderiales bacterium]|jgi:hypothetical protein|nr:hypothetical protein [Burkholderiales bacterium]
MNTQKKSVPKQPDIEVTTNPKKGSCVDCPVEKTITVTYSIKPAGGGSTRLSGLPYAISIDGVVLPAFAEKPYRTEQKEPTIAIKFVKAGQKVALYLGSDAKTKLRNTPPFEVTAGQHDINVVIQETAGKHAADTTVTLKSSDKDKKVDTYTGTLNGDLWMKISQKFSAADVDAELPADAAPELKEAIKKIYSGQFDSPMPDLKLEVSLGDKKSIQLNWQTAAFNNCRQNITQVDVVNDVIPRANPKTYYAALRAAQLCQLDGLEISSGWRPMIGSVLHRIGVGLDVVKLENSKEKTLLNRPIKPDETKLRDDAEAKAKLSKEKAEALKKLKTAKHKVGEKPPTPEDIKQAETELQAAQKAEEFARKKYLEHIILFPAVAPPETAVKL